MALLESDEAAVRLARAIVRDIELYNGAIIAAGGDLSESIAEGRELYKSRVLERFYPFFEDALMARDLTRLDGRPASVRPASPPPGAPAAPKPHTPHGIHDSFLVPLPERRPGAGLVGIVFVLLLLAAAGAGWFLRGSAP